MLKLNLPDMSCGHCAGTVTKAVKSVDPQASVDVDLATKNVTITSSADAKALEAALKEAGYPAHAA